MGQDLMGFLSDFRSATAATAVPAESKPRARRAPALAPEPPSDAAHHSPAGHGPHRTEDVPYYTPPTGRVGAGNGVAEQPTWTPPESDDFPYYAPPPVMDAPGPESNWAPPMGDPVDWNPPISYSPPEGPRRPTWIVAAVVAAVAVIGGVGTMLVMKSSPSLGGLSADQVMAKAVAAAHKAGTFHVEATESQGGQVVHMSIDVGVGGGTINSSMGGHPMELRVVKGGVYLRGDAAALSQMGFSDSFGAQYADQWLTVPATAPDIQQMAQSLDASQIVDQFLHLSGPLTRMPQGQGGGVTLQGTVPDNQFNQGSGAGDTATLVVSSKEPFVPVSISFSDPGNGSTQMMFSHWGEQVALAVPPNAVALPPGAGS
jgi:hypothetical protein